MIVSEGEGTKQNNIIDALVVAHAEQSRTQIH